VATPSLYKHVGGIADLRMLVAARILNDMTERFTAAVVGRAGDDAVTALLREYRAYAQQRPARYLAMPADPLGDPALADAAWKLLNVFLAVLRGYGLEGPDAIQAVRRARVIAHGFASLEASASFGLPEDLDETHRQLIEMYLASLRQTIR
jgi:hypothetical protein